MENREVVNKEALLNKALEPEFSDDDRYDILLGVAQDFLRDKLFYLGCAKIYEEAGNEELVNKYRLDAERVDRVYLNPLIGIIGEIKLPISWPMEPEDIEEIRKYFGDEYFEREDN